jgi:Trk K+ transport system NAD-binding subunit
VLRAGEMIVPRGPTRFQTGDQVILLTIPGAQEELERLARAKPP